MHARDLKPQPNRCFYVEAVRRMTPEERLTKVEELSAMTQALLRVGIRQRFPSASEHELHRIYLERIDRCRRRAS